ncbi:hypothetical protein [Streptomyces sp. NPDC000229]|uniref:hypothetical protein n=1 Tax=Streptomyces sp. NPDC000229 TaxID=3154247 RepID=UPI00331E64D8
MIPQYVDTTSESYASGQSFGVLLVTAGVAALVWRLSAGWRRAAGPDASRARRRRTVVLGVLALIGAGGFTKAMTVYDPEPRAAETSRPAPGNENGTGTKDGAPAWAADEPDPPAGPRTVVAPAKVGDYRLLPTPAPGPKAAGKRWLYGKGEDEGTDAVLHVNTVDWDPGLAEEKRRDSITQEFRNFFAGAKALEASSFEPGPLGGRMSCAYLDRYGTKPALCAWSDATTFGSLLLRTPTTLDAAADTARDFRTAAERP